MLRSVALATILLALNPILVSSSEPIQLAEAFLEHRTSNNKTDLIATNPVKTPKNYHSGSSHYIEITGYSSTPDQTDSTPFITASGTHVRVGVIAANWLPIGSQVRIPELFGDQVFIVEDRMHPRFQNRIDIWFPDRESARLFGKQYAKVEIL